MNYLTKKQLSIIIFFIPLIFKMAMLPSLLYNESGVDSYFGIALITVVEFLQMWLILFIVSKGGMAGIKKMYGKNVQRALALPFLFVMGTKCVAFLTEIYTYICDFLFYNISEVPIVIALLLVIFYLALKGAKVIGRLFELSIWFIPLIFIVGLLFGKVTLNVNYLTPLFVNGAGKMFSGLDKYLIYAFDFSPLLFFKIEPKKHTGVVVSAVLCVIAVTGCYMLLIASYGRATFLVNDAFARLASFNTVVSEIGTLDWPSALLWLTTSICNVALKLAAMAEIVKMFNIKKGIGLGAVCVTFGVLILWVFPGFKEILKVMTGTVRYFVIGLEIVIPFILLVLYAIYQKRQEGKLETAI